MLKYNLNWPDDGDALKIEFHMIEKGGKFEFEGKKVGEGLFHHYREAIKLLWPNEYMHRWTDLILSEILNNTITVVTGPKDCVAGHTRILNPITGEQPTIEELYNSQTAPIVMTQIGPIKASIPFLKGEKELFEVSCDDGSKFTATANHFVFTDSGYVPVSSLTCGVVLLGYGVSHPHSTLELDPSNPLLGDRSSSKTVQDWKDDCRPSFHSCDEQPRHPSKTFQLFFPLQGDVHALDHGDYNLDGLGHESECIHSYQRPSRHSNARCSFQHHSMLAKTDVGYLPFLRRPSPLCDLFQSLLPSRISAAFPKSSLVTSPCFYHTRLPCNQYMAQRKQVNNIRPIGVGKFYDLTVPIAHHYFSEGVIHHNTGKTRTISKYALVDYWAFPDETLIIISSTTLKVIEARVWGDIKMLFRSARIRYPWLAGNVLDSDKAISTDTTDDVRDMRKGLMCVACKTESGEFTSIAGYVGIKQKRRRHLGNEMQFMGPGMLDSIGNMNSGDYKGVFDGNPIGQNDPLDKLSEPVGGWDALPEPKKTTVWKNRRFLNSRTICLYGLDSPTFDFDDGVKRYSGMLNRDSIERVIAGYGKDSHQYYSQCLGIRRPGLNAKRIITYEICKQGKAFEQVIWDGTPRTKIFALDAAYGGTGGDRCVGGYGEFGKDVEGKIILNVYQPVLVPISVSEGGGIPEDQIARWIKRFCEINSIPPENVFYDSTGRGSLGPSLAKIFSTSIQPVEFGGLPSLRPVTSETYMLDHATGQRRLKTCREHYSKFVSELWWTSRLAIMAEQIRGLVELIVDDGCMRQWDEVSGNKIEVETKLKMKERTGQSPDFYDWFVTLVEGARRRGFTIKNMVNREGKLNDRKWLDDLADKARKLREAHQLKQVA